MTFNEDELDEFLVDKLNLIKRTTPRDPKIARQRRDAYMKKANNQRFDKLVFSIARLFNRKPKQTSFNRRRSLVPFAAAILLIFGLVFGGWGTVYAAQDSQPDEFLYPVRLVVEYLEDFDTVTVSPDGSSRETARDGIQQHDRDVIQGRTGVEDNPKDPPLNEYRYGQTMEWKDRGHFGWNDPITLIEDPTQNGELYGPGPCDWEEFGECGPFGPIGYTYTYTHGLEPEDAPPFKPEDKEQPDPALGWGPGPDEGDGPLQPAEPPQSEDNHKPDDDKKPEEPPGQNDDGGDKNGGKP